MRQILGAVSFTVFDTAATGMLAFHEHHHIRLKKQCQSALRASPRVFYHFVFAIRHHNARHTAMEIALMLEKVEEAPRLIFRVIGLLLLTGIINKLSAFPEIDMNVERLAAI